MVWIVAALFILFLISGAALAYVVGAAAVLSFIASDNIRYLAVLPQRIFSQLDIFALMAMVLFIMTGEVMNRTGVTRHLINFSMTIVGRFKGGLGHVNIMTSLFFAGVSGSADHYSWRYRFRYRNPDRGGRGCGSRSPGGGHFLWWG